LLDGLLQEPRRFLSVSHRVKNRFVQFATLDDKSVSAEAVSNQFLAGRERLSDAACRRLRGLSWKRPGKSSPNFSKRIPPPVSAGDLAGLGVETLRAGFRIASPSELLIRRGAFEPEAGASRRPKGQPRLRRTRTLYEFFVRYPWGLSSIEGYRRAARHFGLRTLEHPMSRGSDSCCLLIHRSAGTLRKAARIDPEDGESLYERMTELGVSMIDHDWRQWCFELDMVALERLGLSAEAVECEEGVFRVLLRKGRS
jgi:hypothetical protein